MTLTRDEVQARISELEAKIGAAPGWGAAVSAMAEELASLMRGLKREPVAVPTDAPSNEEFRYEDFVGTDIVPTDREAETPMSNLDPKALEAARRTASECLGSAEYTTTVHDALPTIITAYLGTDIVPTKAAETPEPVAVGYTNWRGEYGVRTIVPLKVWFGSTEWHPEPQWLLRAIDTEKNAERDFALKDFGHPPADREAKAEQGGDVDEVKTLIASITVDNILHMKNVGGLNNWCSRLRNKLTAALRGQA